MADLVADHEAGKHYGAFTKDGEPGADGCELCLRVCDACAAGNHDFCRGSCEGCGERYHSDPDDLYWLDRSATEDWTPVEVELLRIDGNVDASR